MIEQQKIAFCFCRQAIQQKLAQGQLLIAVPIRLGKRFRHRRRHFGGRFRGSLYRGKFHIIRDQAPSHGDDKRRDKQSQFHSP